MYLWIQVRSQSQGELYVTETRNPAAYSGVSAAQCK